MRNIFAIAAILFCGIIRAETADDSAWQQAPNEGWYVNWDKAVESSRKKNQPIFVLSTSSDSSPLCARLHKEIATSDYFTRCSNWRSTFALLYLDNPKKKTLCNAQKKHNASVRRKLGLSERELPHGKLVSAEGKTLCDLGGYDYAQNIEHLVMELEGRVSTEQCIFAKYFSLKSVRDKKVEWRYAEKQDGVTIHATVPIDTVSELTISEKLCEKAVIGIEGLAFCFAMTSVKIPSSVTEISDNGLFGKCEMLKSIKVDSKNKAYTAVDGVLFSKDKRTLCAYPPAKAAKSYKIPSGVCEILYGAFDNCSKLKSVTIPKTVTSIVCPVFCGGSIRTIEVDKNNPNYISTDGVLFTKDKSQLIAFPRAYAKTSYTVPNTVKELDPCLFFGTTLTVLTIPKGTEFVFRAEIPEDIKKHLLDDLPDALQIVDDTGAVIRERKVKKSEENKTKANTESPNQSDVTTIERMKNMRLPHVRFAPPATLSDAVDWFSHASKTFDRPDVPDKERGFHFTFIIPKSKQVPTIPAFSQYNISFYDALKRVCDSVNYEFEVRNSIISVHEK